MEATIKLLYNYLNDAIYDSEHAFLDPQKLPEEFRELGEELVYYSKCVSETAALAKAISKGNLNVTLPPPGNEIASPLKALHAALKHLTWQTQQVARGDYQQHIDFMGEFSEAFNTMTSQLEYRYEALLKEIENGNRKMEALKQSNSLLKTIIDKMSQWVIVTDCITLKWLYINQQATDAMSRRELEPQIRIWIEQQTMGTAEHMQMYSTEFEIKRGEAFYFFSAVIHPFNWDGHSALVFVISDISSEKEHLYDLQIAAYTDPLTELSNRCYGMKVLNEWLADCRQFILCFTDIDCLKYVNDQFGHSEGDKYIIEVANILRGFSHKSVLCRWGGDEFMLLAEDWTGEKAGNRMEVLRNRLINNKPASGCLYNRNLSYGIIEINSDNSLPANDILSIADERMYEYKRIHKLKM